MSGQTLADSGASLPRGGPSRTTSLNPVRLTVFKLRYWPGRGLDTSATQYAIFSCTGFSDQLASAGQAGEVHQLSLAELYGSQP